jgi:hypothetical protein
MRSLVSGMVFALVGGLFMSGLLAVPCVAEDTPINQWGPFTGQVVDAETGKPIPGAIFFAIWLRIIPGPFHSGETFSDARFAVADRDGRFEIQRRSPPIFSSLIESVDLTCVAPGYRPVLGTAVEPPPPIIHLRPFHNDEEQRRNDNGYSYMLGNIPFDKSVKFERTINEKRREMGLPPIKFSRGVL